MDGYVSRHGVLPPTLVELSRFPRDGTVECPTDKWRVRNNEGRAEILWYRVKSTGYYAIVFGKGNEQWVIAKDKPAQRMAATP